MGILANFVKMFLRRFVIMMMLLPVLAGAKVWGRDLSLSLDSIAAWGKFPKFCVDVYRWGNEFFNGADSAYVTGTGYKFNLKLTADTWGDFYDFRLPEHKSMQMVSKPSTTVGLHLNYMAVSVGYDVNFSKMFEGPEHARRRFNFGFNCSLLAVEYNYVRNNVGTYIKRFGPQSHLHRMDIAFSGIDNRHWTLEGYYFFNHRKYSQSAAFNFGKVQRRSQGTFYAGFYLSHQNYMFDFSRLPFELKEALPDSWVDYRYNVRSGVIAARVGYGYNWVFARHWLLGVSESPILGIRKGTINSTEKDYSFALNNSFRLSVVWNNGRWFSGIVGNVDLGLIYDKLHTMVNSVYSVKAAVGYRFNLW